MADRPLGHPQRLGAVLGCSGADGLTDHRYANSMCPSGRMVSRALYWLNSKDLARLRMFEFKQLISHPMGPPTADNCGYFWHPGYQAPRLNQIRGPYIGPLVVYSLLGVGSTILHSLALTCT